MQEPSNDRTLSWLVTAIAAAYVLWSAFSMSRRVDSFANIFISLGAELPVATRLVIMLSRSTLLWIVALFVVTALVTKELMIQRPLVRIGVSVVIFMLTAFVMSLVTDALFLPMQHLVQQLALNG